MESAAEVQQSGFASAAEEARRGDCSRDPPGWQTENPWNRAGFDAAHTFRRRPEQTRKGNRGGGSEWRAVEQVLPDEPAAPDGHIVDVKGGTDRACQRGSDID